MKKSILQTRRLTLPLALGCLALQPVLARSLPVAARWSIPAASPVTGRIVDEKGNGMPGVNVVVKGTSTGTQTNADGNYTIEVPAGLRSSSPL